jgi:hypothetical protein
MKLLITASVLAAITAIPAQAASPAETVSAALSCNTTSGKVPAVIASLKKLGATAGRDEGDYTLPSPISVFGMPVGAVNVNAKDPDGESYMADTYIAIIHDSTLDAVAKAASLKPIGSLKAQTFVRDTKAGRLTAEVRDGADVWLTCTVTK